MEEEANALKTFTDQKKETTKPRKIILHGTITETRDFNPKAAIGDLPTIRRNQEIIIQLDEDFWQIMSVKKVRIIIEENQLPAQIRDTVNWPSNTGP